MLSSLQSHRDARACIKPRREDASTPRKTDKNASADALFQNVAGYCPVEAGIVGESVQHLEEGE